MVAPAYHSDNYVDCELSANLDSTFAFEGPEKLLEIWFWPSESDPAMPTEGLRLIPLEDWVKVLDLVNCKILSMKSSKHVDAYLLSESSLFVFPHKMILKTCGTTTTLACLDKVFEVVNDKLKLASKFSPKNIFKMFYSRRSFMFPEKQIHVHKDWKNEVALLNSYFDNGKSYVVGDFSSDDHWFLYMAGQHQQSIMEGSDQTFEILMTELDQEKAKQFLTLRKPGVASLLKNGADESDLGHEIGLQTMVESKLSSIFEKETKSTANGYLPSPSMSDSMEFGDSDSETVDMLFIHDAFSFTPCGFSLNSVCVGGGYYYTLHVTPENGWSYALFETNYPFSKPDSQVSIRDVLVRVLNIFGPRKFSMTLIHEGNLWDLSSLDNIAPDFASLQNCECVLLKIGYVKQEKALYDLKNENKLLYLNFEKK